MFFSHIKHILPIPTSLSTCRGGWWITSPIPQTILQFDLIVSTLRGRLFSPPLSLGCSWTLCQQNMVGMMLWNSEAGPCEPRASAFHSWNVFHWAPATMSLWSPSFHVEKLWWKSPSPQPLPEPVIGTTANHVRTFWKLLSSQHFLWHQ